MLDGQFESSILLLEYLKGLGKPCCRSTSFASAASVTSASMATTLTLNRLCKAAQSCMRLLCIVQSRMRLCAAFVSLCMTHANLAYCTWNAVGVDSGIRCEQEVWQVAFYVALRQHLGHSRTAATKPNNDVKMRRVTFGKWFNVSHPTWFTYIYSKSRWIRPQMLQFLVRLCTMPKSRMRLMRLLHNLSIMNNY